MTEESVTKSILKWLIANGWDIVSFDFPQSGTGTFLHPNCTNEKNKNSINPDIVAVRNGICVFFENKNRFYYSDFKKVNQLIVTNNYTDAITDLLKNYAVKQIYYGIGIPTSAYGTKSKDSELLVDFIVGVNEGGSITVLYSNSNLFYVL